jgi:DNA-binding MarR family transcriptional regulator
MAPRNRKNPPRKRAASRVGKKRIPGRHDATSARARNGKSAPTPLWTRPGYLVRRLHQIHYALFFEECTAFDITPVQYGLLTTLSVNPDLDQNSLGRELGIDRTNVADVLARLERRGLLERRRSPRDKRMVLARLTPAGERVTKEMYDAMHRAQKRLLAPLPRDARRAFVAAMVRLIETNNHLGRTIFRPS